MAVQPIHERYDLELLPITIGSRHLEIYGVSNWDKFIARLAEKGDDYIPEFPFWIKLWEAAFVLADELVHLDLDKESEILEIGAGMGIVGIFMAALGHRVTITDYDDDVLELLNINVSRNDLETVSVRKLDWLEPDLDNRYDIICGSEIVYQEAFFKPMIDLFRRYLKTEGAVYLAHSTERECIVRFIGQLPGRFDIENRIKTLSGEGESSRVTLHTIRITE